MKTNQTLLLSSILLCTLLLFIPKINAQFDDPAPSIVKNRAVSFNVSSLLEIDGRPAMAFCEINANYVVRYQIATDSKGTSWGAPVSVDLANFAGIYTIDMAIINGNPAVANCTAQANDIRYTRALNTTGDFWASTVVVASGISSSSTAIRYVKLKEVNGKPAIAYYDADDGDLYYVQATDATGSTWGTPVLVASVGNVGNYLSFSVIDGRPAIAYYDATNGDLKYIRANDADGSTWGTAITVWSSGNVGLHASLTTVNGRPAIAFGDFTNKRLLYMRASDSTGSSWSIPSIVASHYGESIDLEIADGKPAIAYYTGYGAADLRYVISYDIDGTTWATPEVVDDGSDAMGNILSMAIIDGNPAISYQDYTNGDLKYARSSSATGIVLPVELTFFRGENQEKENHLNWETASEKNNKGFEIERSLNGRDFENIGFVEGNGNAANINQYDFTDENVEKGIHYYRLKQIDFDGAYEYSKIVQITVAGEGFQLGKIYPNPSKNEMVKMDYFTEENSEIRINILDVTGKIIFENNATLEEGNHSLELDFSHLEKGVYFVQFHYLGKNVNRKIVIQ